MNPGLSTGLLSSSLALHFRWMLYSFFLYTSPAPKREFTSAFLFPVFQFLRWEVISESAGSVPGKNGEGVWTWCPVLCLQLLCFGLGLTRPYRKSLEVLRKCLSLIWLRTWTPHNLGSWVEILRITCLNLHIQFLLNCSKCLFIYLFI